MLDLFLYNHGICPCNIEYNSDKSDQSFQRDTISLIVLEFSVWRIIFIDKDEDIFTVACEQHPEYSCHDTDDLFMVDLNAVEVVVQDEGEEWACEWDSVGYREGQVVVSLGVEDLMQQH